DSRSILTLGSHLYIVDDREKHRKVASPLFLLFDSHLLSLFSDSHFSDNSLSIPTLGSQRSIVDHQRSTGFHRRQQLHTII
ncbi:hypothetical protein Dimus_011277, partial [Dionaea muscipula]